jgi:hypothetical protein
MNKSNNALIAKVSDKIDDLAMNAGPEDVVMGDPVAGASALKEARGLWGRGAKLGRVEDLLGRAGLNAASSGSGGNIENATRQQLKRLLTNPKLTRGLTPDEIEAAKKAVLGTKGQNLLRHVGKLSPQGNGLMMGVNLLHTAASPATGIPAAAVGYGAKKLAESMTSKNAEALRTLVASGGKKAASDPQRLAIQNQTMALLRALMMGGAAQVPQ